MDDLELVIDIGVVVLDVPEDLRLVIMTGERGRSDGRMKRGM